MLPECEMGRYEGGADARNYTRRPGTPQRMPSDVAMIRVYQSRWMLELFRVFSMLRQRINWENEWDGSKTEPQAGLPVT